MNATNTKGIIAEAAKKKSETTEELTPSQVMNRLLNCNAIQTQLKQTLQDNAGAFTASLLSLFNSDAELQTHKPKDVLVEALKAASLQLPIEKSLGFAYIAVYNGKPRFQLGYRGMVQLCMRTGKYKYINADCVYEGETVKQDRKRGIISIEGEPISQNAIGYFAHIETHDGFEHSMYWTVERVQKHKDQFSKSGFAWKDNFDAMAIKTVLRYLLSHYGVMSIEMSEALAAESEPAPPLPDTDPENEVETTAEVSDTLPEQDEGAPSDTPAPDDYPLCEMSGAVYRYTLPEIPPSNNDFIGRVNCWEYQDEKKRWAALIAVCCRPKPSEPLPRAVVTLTYHFKDKRRRDPDNYSGKMILDGLVRSGIIKDDSFSCIDLQLKAVCDKGGYTEILIEEGPDEI